MAENDGGRVEVGVRPPRKKGKGRVERPTTLVRVVGLLVLVTGTLLVWVAVGTVNASSDMSVRSGLDYEVFLEAVDDLLHEAGDSALLRFDEVEAQISRRRTVTYDTINILADVRAFPAFDKAGFLFDQVQAYNRFQRERLELGKVDPDWWDRLKAYNPSIFRVARRPDGTTGPGRAPSAWSLRVRSPMEGEWDGEVRTIDVVRGVGLTSPRLTLPLERQVELVRPGGRRGQLCEFQPSSEGVKVFCLSEQRIPQAILHLPAGERAPGWAEAGWADLWLDGRRIESGDSTGLEPGSVLTLEPLEPLVFGEHWEGILSSEQWINGRMRRRNNLPPPLDLFSGLGNGPAAVDRRVSADASVDLSVNFHASQDLTHRLAQFLEQEVDLPLDFGTIVLARVPDGEVVAVAEVGERHNQGRSSILERIAPGSAVKPILAAAILSQRPELASMEIAARSGMVSSVLGMPRVPARRAFSTALNCPAPDDGVIDLRYFLRCSNNEYAAALLVAGLAQEGVPGSGWRGSRELPLDGRMVPSAALLRSPLSLGLAELFDLPTDPTISDSRIRSRRVWDGLTFSDGTPFPVPFELLPSESRPALLAPGFSVGTELSLLYRYSYGAWENQWTLLDMTNAFARIVTDRRVQLRFFPSAGLRAGVAGDTLGLARHPWYPAFMAGLRGVGVDGTASGLLSSWREEGLPTFLLAKTGTLNEAGEPSPKDDLFAKSLLFAVGERSEGSRGPMACGLAGGIYLRFSQGPRSGNLPSYQVEFAMERLGSFLMEYWDEFDACPQEEGG